MDHNGSAVRLYVVIIGSQYAGQRIECHDIELHIAADESGLVSACRNLKRPAFKAKHIDGWIALPLQAREAELFGHRRDAAIARDGACFLSKYIRP